MDALFEEAQIACPEPDHRQAADEPATRQSRPPGYRAEQAPINRRHCICQMASPRPAWLWVVAPAPCRTSPTPGATEARRCVVGRASRTMQLSSPTSPRAPRRRYSTGSQSSFQEERDYFDCDALFVLTGRRAMPRAWGASGSMGVCAAVMGASTSISHCPTSNTFTRQRDLSPARRARSPNAGRGWI